MSTLTYHVVLPFARADNGDLVPEEAVQAPSAQAARSRAIALSYRKAGVDAFSRSGDPQLGEFEDAVVLYKHGELPDDLPSP